MSDYNKRLQVARLIPGSLLFTGESMSDYNKRLQDWIFERDYANQELGPDKFKEWLSAHPKPQLTESEHKVLLNARLKDANERNNRRADVFCPIAKGSCRVNCESYSKATVGGTVYEKDKETGDIVMPYITGVGCCTAHILKGRVFHEI